MEAQVRASRPMFSKGQRVYLAIEPVGNVSFEGLERMGHDLGYGPFQVVDTEEASTGSSHPQRVWLSKIGQGGVEVHYKGGKEWDIPAKCPNEGKGTAISGAFLRPG